MVITSAGGRSEKWEGAFHSGAIDRIFFEGKVFFLDLPNIGSAISLKFFANPRIAKVFSITRTIFFTVGQNNFGNKITFLTFIEKHI